MFRQLSILFALFFISNTMFAQWGGGSMGGGGGGNDQRSRPQTQNKPTLDMDVAPKGNSSIIGAIVDSEDISVPVEFASIALIDSKTNKPIDGTMADIAGKFEIKRVAEGTYNLVLSFVGYESKKLENIKVTKGKDVNLGLIKLKTASILLEGVVITGDKPLIEEKVDRLVYNAERDLSAAGGDASDVLKNVPMLSVDLDGNVSLRGSENIQVLINNKPSTIVASSIADALKMIPAELIKSVEVITSPSARYDAEGTAGIINIITKKSTLKGLNLNLNAGVGNRSSNLGLNGNYRVGKLGFSFGGFGRGFYGQSRNESYNENFVGGLITDQVSEGKSRGIFGRYNVGFDYDLGNNQTLFGGVALGSRSFKRQNSQDFNYFRKDSLGNSSLFRNELRDLDAINVGNTLDYTLDYVKTFENGKEWSVSGMFSNTNAKTNNYTNFLNGISNAITKKQWNDNANLNEELSFQTDFLNPIGKNQQLEVGAKTVLRTIDSKYLYLISDSVTVSQDRDEFLRSQLFEDPKNPGGGLKYDQSIYAAYASYTYSTKNKFNIKVGGRFEYTTLTANQSLNQIGTENVVNKPFSDSYPVFVPSLNLSKPFGSYTTKLSYNYRISRPGLRQLNPNIDISDPLNVSMGTTELTPERTHNMELSLSRSVGSTYFTASTFGRYSGNTITRVTMTSQGASQRFPNIVELQNLDPNALVTTFENIGKESTVGGNVYVNFKLAPKWSVNTNLDGYYVYIQGQEWKGGSMVPKSNDGFTFGARASTDIKLNNGWAAQANGGWRGKRVSLQGVSGGSPRYSVSIRKDFTKAFSLGLGADNFFGIMKRPTTTETSQFIRRDVSYQYERNIRLTLTYKIGNMRFVENKSKVSNTDTKSSGDDDN